MQASNHKPDPSLVAQANMYITQQITRCVQSHAQFCYFMTHSFRPQQMLHLQSSASHCCHLCLSRHSWASRFLARHLHGPASDNAMYSARMSCDQWKNGHWKRLVKLRLVLI